MFSEWSKTKTHEVRDTETHAAEFDPRTVDVGSMDDEDEREDERSVKQ